MWTSIARSLGCNELDVAQGAGRRYECAFPPGFKSSRAATVHTTPAAAVQQQHSSTSALHVDPCDSHGAFLCSYIFMCVQCLRAQPHVHIISTHNFKSKHTSSSLILSHISTQLQYSGWKGTRDYDDAPPFQLVTPLGFQVNFIPKGNLVTYVRWHQKRGCICT